MRTTLIVDHLRAFADDATLLVRKEIELARAEMGEKFDQALSGVIAMVSGLLIAFVALIVLVEAVVVALSRIMPPSLAALLVGVVLAIIGFIAFRVGQNKLSAENMKPRRTIRSAREGVQEMKEKL